MLEICLWRSTPGFVIVADCPARISVNDGFAGILTKFVHSKAFPVFLIFAGTGNALQPFIWVDCNCFQKKSP
jgi:hypothetical protein